ncbi:MAG: fumarylacetoacetate hydrolase family protein [Planctomycetes bacterium]|nr:fumarylacetoacetate hydrolase family protein [Planctomycetota bacterium]
MRLVRFQRNGDTLPRHGALVGDDRVLDFTAPAADLHQPRELLAWCDLNGAALPAALELARQLELQPSRREELVAALLPREEVRLLAPVDMPGKVICIGLNYRDHAAESGMEIPERPLVFSKFGSCVVGPDDAVRLPEGESQTDYEAELAFVIGRHASRVPLERAMEHVLGYTNANDVSARAFQFADGQWTRGKACDTFCPLGPFLLTADEVADPHQLRIGLRLNGRTMQDSRTDQLVFGIPELVVALSGFVTLEPGDVVLTGTPPGVGFARKPPVYLQDGDVMEVEIEGLGVLRNTVSGSLI